MTHSNSTHCPPDSPKARASAWVWLLVGLALLCTLGCALMWLWPGGLADWLHGLQPPQLHQLKLWQAELAQLQARQPATLAAAYVAVFTALTALCLPGCGVLLLLAGSTFGWVWGGLLSLLASTAGATLTMLAARHGLRPWVARRFGPRLDSFSAAMASHHGRTGAHYLLSLRLLPVIPFVPVNLMAGLTHVRVSTFFGVSFVGMLPGTLVYVHAGQALGQVTRLQDLWSASAAGAVALLGVLSLLPLAWQWWAARRGQ